LAFPSIKYAFRHAVRRNPWVARQCAELRSRECLDPAAHRERQEYLLARLLRAARRAPAYAPFAANAPARYPLAYVLEHFPIVDKAALLARGNDFFAGGRAPNRHFTSTAATSGTTGTPLDVHRSVASILWEEAFHLQHRQWAGWQAGERQVVLRGDLVVPIGRRKPPYWMHDAVGGQLVLSTRHLDRKTARAFAEELRNFGATMLRAYPSAAYELATFVEEAGLPVRFGAVITGSEMLYDFQRRRIESAFRTRVFDFYSMAERVAFAAECEHGRMHVNPEYGIVEIVDGDGRATDGEGAIVGTALHNHAMPLIRYRMTDTARWSREPCPCGRTYPVLEDIGGRLADQLYDLDGRAVNCTVIGFAFDHLRNIRKAQVVQNAADRWVIRIVPGPDYTAVDGAHVLDKLAKEVSPRVNALIDLVDHIPALPSGKYKWVVQEWRRPSAQPAPVTRWPVRETREAAC
jgi:phenylacetate-CoA ligase